MSRAARLFFRGFLLQALFNARGRQSGGMRWILGERATGLSSEPFNANPVVAGYALGLVDRGDGEAYEKHREALGAALGGVGDRLMWGLLRPISVVVGLAAAAAGPLAAAVALLAVYNPPELALRWRAANRGLQGLPAIQSDFSRSGVIRFAPHLARVCALGVGIVAGSWLAGLVIAGRLIEAAAGACAIVVGWLILRRRRWGFWRMPLAALLLGGAWLTVGLLRAWLGVGNHG
jgi:hypothetical protein